MSAFTNHFVFEFKTGLRNPTLMLMFYLFPLAFYAMVGLIMTQINPGFTETLIPAMVVFVVMVATILGMPGPLVEAREAGIYRSFKINGVPALSILAIPALTTIFHTLIVSVVISLTAGPLFQGAAPVHWGTLALLAALAAFSMAAIGSLIGVVASGARSTVLWAQMIFLPSMMLGGLMVPLELLPESILPFASILPSTHAMQAIMGLSYQQHSLIPSWLAVGTLAAGGVLAFGMALYLFNWDSRNQTRRGHPAVAMVAFAPYLAAAVYLLVN
jgi:ABC-2 type transport system permease protein